jgi:hypothetical protein
VVDQLISLHPPEPLDDRLDEVGVRPDGASHDICAGGLEPVVEHPRGEEVGRDRHPAIPGGACRRDRVRDRGFGGGDECGCDRTPNNRRQPPGGSADLGYGSGAQRPCRRQHDRLGLGIDLGEPLSDRVEDRVSDVGGHDRPATRVAHSARQVVGDVVADRREDRNQDAVADLLEGLDEPRLEHVGPSEHDLHPLQALSHRIPQCGTDRLAGMATRAVEGQDEPPGHARSPKPRTVRR